MGPGFSVKLGCAITVVGAWLRVLISKSFSLVYLGQIIAAIGGPFIYNANCKVSANWFRVQQLVLVTSIITLFGTSKVNAGRASSPFAG